jgi:flagellar basal body P-ring protein FlgI
MNVKARRWQVSRLLVCAAGFWLSGCAGDHQDGASARNLSDANDPNRSARSSYLIETIGDKTLLGGGDGLPMRGFGLVIGLGDKGSHDCPSALRAFLIEHLDKEHLKSGKSRQERPSAAALIDSRDTAVVEVTGVIPAGAVKGTPVDVQVDVIAGTATQSLEGGWLLPTELRLFQVEAAGRGMLAGRAVARVSGPVFTNPFAPPSGSGAGSGNEERAPIRSGPESLRGYVLGSARVLESRPVRLLLTEPSYPLARRIESRLNEHFGQRPRTAEAESRGFVLVSTPQAYATQPERFIQLVSHLYLRNDPPFRELKLRELCEELRRADEDLEHVALVWEGLGRAAVPRLQPLYEDSDPTLRYYAARTGLRLGDATALVVLGRVAADPGHPQRVAAVRELSRCPFPGATARLSPLLDSEDVEVRVCAYEALRDSGHPAIQTTAFPHDLDPTRTGFYLDAVKSAGPPMIYVQRSREARLVVFGRDVPVRVPLFYSHPEDRAILNAATEMDDITVTYKARYAQRFAAPIRVPPRVTELTAALGALPFERAEPRGAGLTYTQVVRVLAALVDDGMIPARLHLEHTPITDLLGPARSPQRPEADAPSDAESPPPEPARER